MNKTATLLLAGGVIAALAIVPAAGSGGKNLLQH